MNLYGKRVLKAAIFFLGLLLLLVLASHLFMPKDNTREAGIEVVVSALDNDECGKKGTAWLKKNFNVVRFSYLKGFKDPGDMDKKSFDKMFGRTKQKLRKVFKKGN